MILVATVVIGIGTVAIMRLPPVYYAEAVIEVLPNYIGNLKQDRELQVTRSSDFVNTQVHAITSYDVVFDAVLNLGSVEETAGEPAQSDQLRAEALMNTIDATQVPRTYRIHVSIKGAKPEGLADKVNAVVNAYQDKMIKNKFIGKDIRISNLTKRKMELQTEIRSLISRKNLLIEELSPVPFRDDLENPYEEIMINAMEASSAAERNRLNAENNLAAIKFKIENFSRDQIPRISQDVLERDPYFRSFSLKLNDHLGVLRSQLKGLPVGHPGRPAITKRIHDFEEQMESELVAVRQRIRDELYTERKAQLEDEATALTAAVKEAEFLEARLSDEAQEHKKQLAHFSSLYNESVNLRDRILRIRSQLSAIDDRLDFFELEENAPGFVNVVSLARDSDTPLEGKKPKLMIVLLVAAFGLSSVIAIAIDYFSPWIKSPFDVEDVLGYPPLGWILECNNEKSVAFAKDQKRRLALAIKRQHATSGRKTFALTSVKSGGGTTELTFELARELENIGVRALAVEANPFSPDDEYFDDENNPGLISALAKTASLADTIVPKTDALPARIPIGDTNDTHHLSVDSEILSLFNDSGFDVILFDTPPILLSADAELMSHLADGTLLIVEAEGVTQGEVRRAVKIINQISPPLFAVILNRVRVYPGIGYFGKLIKEYEAGLNS